VKRPANKGWLFCFAGESNPEKAARRLHGKNKHPKKGFSAVRVIKPRRPIPIIRSSEKNSPQGWLFCFAGESNPEKAARRLHGKNKHPKKGFFAVRVIKLRRPIPIIHSKKQRQDFSLVLVFCLSRGENPGAGWVKRNRIRAP
jgi:hypothetical protein